MNKSWLGVIKGMGMIFLLTLLWLIIFAAFDSSGSKDNYEPFNGASIVCGFISYVILLFILQYHKIVHLRSEINGSFHAIKIKQGHVQSLIVQLKDVTDKMLDHELKMSVKNTFSELIEEDKYSENMISDSNDSQYNQTKKKNLSNSSSRGSHDTMSQVSDKVTKLVERIERDTKGSSDKGLRDLISEIKEAEALVTNQRLYHNETVSNYNRTIYMLPFAFLRATLGHSEQSYI